MKEVAKKVANKLKSRYPDSFKFFEPQDREKVTKNTEFDKCPYCRASTESRNRFVCQRCHRCMLCGVITNTTACRVCGNGAIGEF